MPQHAMITAARHLHRAGQWDVALTLLGDDEPRLRAEILVDRHFWRNDDPAEARSAIDALGGDSPPAALLRGQLAYFRLIFDRAPLPDDADTAAAEFNAARQDSALGGWATFWHGLLINNVQRDRPAARPYYAEALTTARDTGDQLLESYVVRHQAAHLRDSDPVAEESLLRRSLHLRAAVGARPHVAAAQQTLASVLPPCPERDTLLEAARIIAVDLDLPGLLRALDQQR